MNAWVYHGRTFRDQANELVEKLRAGDEFGLVIPVSSRHYQGEIHRGDVVYHDGTRRDIVWANEREGVECRQFAGSEMVSETGARTASLDEPKTTPPDAEGTDKDESGALPDGEEVRETSPGWFKAFRGGKQVGAARRSADDARALLDASRS